MSDADLDRQGRQGRQEPSASVDVAARSVIDSALKVRRSLGPGLEQLLRLHEVQVLTYLRLSSLPLALLINFNVGLLKNGVKRLVLSR
jgi:hypothetical protein